MGSFIFLASFLPIWNFLCPWILHQIVFCIKNEHHQKYFHFHYYLAVAQYQLLLENDYLLPEEQYNSLIHPFCCILPTLKLTLCVSLLWKIVFCIKHHHENLLFLLFGSTTVSNVIEEWLYIVIRRLSKVFHHFGCVPPNLKLPLCLSILRKFMFL